MVKNGNVYDLSDVVDHITGPRPVSGVFFLYYQGFSLVYIMFLMRLKL